MTKLEQIARAMHDPMGGRREPWPEVIGCRRCMEAARAALEAMRPMRLRAGEVRDNAAWYWQAMIDHILDEDRRS